MPRDRLTGTLDDLNAGGAAFAEVGAIAVDERGKIWVDVMAKRYRLMDMAEAPVNCRRTVAGWHVTVLNREIMWESGPLPLQEPGRRYEPVVQFDQRD